MPTTLTKFEQYERALIAELKLKPYDAIGKCEAKLHQRKKRFGRRSYVPAIAFIQKDKGILEFYSSLTDLKEKLIDGENVTELFRIKGSQIENIAKKGKKSGMFMFVIYWRSEGVAASKDKPAEAKIKVTSETEMNDWVTAMEKWIRPQKESSALGQRKSDELPGYEPSSTSKSATRTRHRKPKVPRDSMMNYSMDHVSLRIDFQLKPFVPEYVGFPKGYTPNLNIKFLTQDGTKKGWHILAKCSSTPEEKKTYAWTNKSLKYTRTQLTKPNGKQKHIWVFFTDKAHPKVELSAKLNPEALLDMVAKDGEKYPVNLKKSISGQGGKKERKSTLTKLIVTKVREVVDVASLQQIPQLGGSEKKVNFLDPVKEASEPSTPADSRNDSPSAARGTRSARPKKAKPTDNAISEESKDTKNNENNNENNENDDEKPALAVAAAAAAAAGTGATIAVAAASTANEKKKDTAAKKAANKPPKGSFNRGGDKKVFRERRRAGSAAAEADAAAAAAVVGGSSAAAAAAAADSRKTSSSKQQQADDDTRAAKERNTKAKSVHVDTADRESEAAAAAAVAASGAAGKNKVDKDRLPSVSKIPRDKSQEESKQVFDIDMGMCTPNDKTNEPECRGKATLTPGLLDHDLGFKKPKNKEKIDEKHVEKIGKEMEKKALERSLSPIGDQFHRKTSEKKSENKKAEKREKNPLKLKLDTHTHTETEENTSPLPTPSRFLSPISSKSPKLSPSPGKMVGQKHFEFDRTKSPTSILSKPNGGTMMTPTSENRKKNKNKNRVFFDLDEFEKEKKQKQRQTPPKSPKSSTNVTNFKKEGETKVLMKMKSAPSLVRRMPDDRKTASPPRQAPISSRDLARIMASKKPKKNKNTKPISSQNNNKNKKRNTTNVNTKKSVKFKETTPKAGRVFSRSNSKSKDKKHDRRVTFSDANMQPPQVKSRPTIVISTNSCPNLDASGELTPEGNEKNSMLLSPVGSRSRSRSRSSISDSEFQHQKQHSKDNNAKSNLGTSQSTIFIGDDDNKEKVALDSTQLAAVKNKKPKKKQPTNASQGRKPKPNEQMSPQSQTSQSNLLNNELASTAFNANDWIVGGAAGGAAAGAAAAHAESPPAPEEKKNGQTTVLSGRIHKPEDGVKKEGTIYRALPTEFEAKEILDANNLDGVRYTDKSGTRIVKETMFDRLLVDTPEIWEDEGDEVMDKLEDEYNKSLDELLEEKSNLGQSWELKITVKSGHNLISRDDTGFSDPYVKIRMFNKNRKLWKHKGREKHTRKQTLNPVWDYDVEDPIKQKAKDTFTRVEFECWDYDRAIFGGNGNDDFMGFNALTRTEIIQACERSPSGVAEFHLKMMLKPDLDVGAVTNSVAALKSAERGGTIVVKVEHHALADAVTGNILKRQAPKPSIQESDSDDSSLMEMPHELVVRSPNRKKADNWELRITLLHGSNLAPVSSRRNMAGSGRNPYVKTNIYSGQRKIYKELGTKMMQTNTLNPEWDFVVDDIPTVVCNTFTSIHFTCYDERKGLEKLAGIVSGRKCLGYNELSRNEIVREIKRWEKEGRSKGTVIFELTLEKRHWEPKGKNDKAQGTITVKVELFKYGSKPELYSKGSNLGTPPIQTPLNLVGQRKGSSQKMIPLAGKSVQYFKLTIDILFKSPDKLKTNIYAKFTQDSLLTVGSEDIIQSGLSPVLHGKSTIDVDIAIGSFQFWTPLKLEIFDDKDRVVVQSQQIDLLSITSGTHIVGDKDESVIWDIVSISRVERPKNFPLQSVIPKACIDELPDATPHFEIRVIEGLDMLQNFPEQPSYVKAYVISKEEAAGLEKRLFVPDQWKTYESLVTHKSIGASPKFNSELWSFGDAREVKPGDYVVFELWNLNGENQDDTEIGFTAVKLYSDEASGGIKDGTSFDGYIPVYPPTTKPLLEATKKASMGSYKWVNTNSAQQRKLADHPGGYLRFSVHFLTDSLALEHLQIEFNIVAKATLKGYDGEEKADGPCNLSVMERKGVFTFEFPHYGMVRKVKVHQIKAIEPLHIGFNIRMEDDELDVVADLTQIRGMKWYKWLLRLQCMREVYLESLHDDPTDQGKILLQDPMHQVKRILKTTEKHRVKMKQLTSLVKDKEEELKTMAARNSLVAMEGEIEKDAMRALLAHMDDRYGADGPATTNDLFDKSNYHVFLENNVHYDVNSALLSQMKSIADVQTKKANEGFTFEKIKTFDDITTYPERRGYLGRNHYCAM